MGKRSDFKRRPNDLYDTPFEAVGPLIPHLPYTTYTEPCVGNGRLIGHLSEYGLVCTGGFDIQRDALLADADDFTAECIITNPPWSRPLLHGMIQNFRKYKPTYLLFDADWAHTKQSHELILGCSKIIAVGRVKWIPDSKHTGKDNCCWYEFLPGHAAGPVFIGRQ